MKCPGGDLIIKFQEKDKEYSKITHTGPAQEVFKGSFVIQKMNLQIITPINIPSNQVNKNI